LPTPIQCPKCREFQLYRAHATTLLQKGIRTIFGVKRYRCRNCKWKGWLGRQRTYSKQDKNHKSAIFYILLAVGAIVVAFIFKFFFHLIGIL